MASTSGGTFPVLLRWPKLLISAIAISVLVVVVGWRFTDLQWWREQTLETAGTRAANLATVASEHLRQTFAAVDTSLRQLAIHSRRVGGPNASDREWDAILQAAIAAIGDRGSISVTDAEGIIRHSSISTLEGEPRRDQYLFKQLSSRSRDELVVDTPFLTPSNVLIIPLGRRLTDANGRFVGIVVATLFPESHRGFFKTLDVGKEGVVWAFHPDGVVLIREPSEENPIGENAVGNPVFDAARHARSPGFLRGPLQPGGPIYRSAYHRIDAPPMVIAVSLSEQELLADWRRQRRGSVTGLLALSVTLSATLLLLFRQIDARLNVERQLREMQRLESIRLKDTNDRLAVALASEQDARRESEAANCLKDEFLMTVSHELRTPLTAIYGWARMLATGGLRDEQRSRALATIERNARAQARLIDDLLDVSRVISGKIRIDVRSVNVGDVLNAAVDAVRPAIEAKSIDFTMVVDADVGVTSADPDRLQQIVWNLLSNAIKFTADHGRVELRATRTATHVAVVVSDTGVGIAPDFLPYVFDRFRQQDGGSRRRHGGLGLGLAIVRHLVELHGGSVEAVSEGEGRGATFRVLLPFRPSRGSSAPDVHIPTSRAAQPTARRLDGVRVLVVDDEPEARELFTLILEGVGASVVTAASADAALKILEDGTPDVLVSDIEMPHEDGYSLVEKAIDLTRGRGEHLNAVAVTAYARSADRVRALSAGFQWHLAKPVEPAELVSVVASLTHDLPGGARPH